MIDFKNFGELVEKVNSALGDFCNEFGDRRKELAKLGRRPTRGILFTYDVSGEKDWAINEGGGTEVQYHIGINEEDLELRYGIAFNTFYVPFKNDMSMVDYLEPFMRGFLKNQMTIKHILPNYDFIFGNISDLENPKMDTFVLFGKTIPVLKDTVGNYSIQQNDFNDLIEDLKKQFEAYQIIFEEKNNYKKETMNIQNYINVLLQKGQIILQGPPGTGKTYTAKDLAEQIIFYEITPDKKSQKQRLENSQQFKLIQFHPAYSYEDFVRGIVANSKDKYIEYVTENKVFTKFAKAANENYLNSKKPISDYSKEKWVKEKFSLFCKSIQEELLENGTFKLTEKVAIINIDGEAFRYKGGWSDTGNRMYFKDIIQSYIDGNSDRQDLENNKNLSGLAKAHASYYFRVLDFFKKFLIEKNFTFTPTNNEEAKLDKFVFIIDEINRANLPAVLGELIYALEYRDHKFESMYSIEREGNTLIIPPNLFIIGTMNSADRSVGHIDYAIRRRFAFIDVLPQVLEGDSFELDLFKTVSELFIKNFDEYVNDNTVRLINSEHLSEEFRPEDVWLGHSYFIKNGNDFELRKKYEIIPILKEYLKDGILKQSAETIIHNL